MDKTEKLLNEIRRRIGDYTQQDIVAERDKLIALWKAAHPEAVKEVSVALHPLICIQKRGANWMRGNPRLHKKDPDEIWANDIYNVTLRAWASDPVFGTDCMIQLGISTHDGTARHDWREFQAIKNQLAGPECEAFELYPAESRLLDPSNYYTLWCFPKIQRLKVGLEIRDVKDQDTSLAPQRGFQK